MGQATQMLEWIDGRTVSKVKFDAMSEDEREGKFPLGVLHKDESRVEYTKAYDMVIKAARDGEKIDFGALK